MHVKKMNSTVPLAELKQQYMLQTTAPLDGMWSCGFVPKAPHFGFYQDDALVGFYCVDDEGYLLQFHVSPNQQGRSSQLFASILSGNDAPSGKIKGAFVSTAEPDYLSLCLDQFSNFEVNALMYQQDGSFSAQAHENALDMLDMPPVDATQLSQAVDFAVTATDGPGGWQGAYLANLIDRQELFGLWKQGHLVAIGESRVFDEYQTDYADLGVIVAESERNRGMATRILRYLVAMNTAKGLKSICSTSKTNIAAQKAIGRAGFFARHRILQFHA